MTPKVRRFLRYIGVNLASTVVDYAIFLTLSHAFGLPTVQSVIAYSVAIVVNYWLSKKFVFLHDMSHKSEHRQFMEFFGTGMLGLVLTAAVIWLTVDEMNLPPVDGKTISVLLCFVVLYFVRSRVVFTEKPEGSAA
jgi:putative flippase GtrA